VSNKLPHRYRVLILLFFLLFITYLDRVSIALVDKWIKSEFHLNNTQWGLIGGAFALSYALFEIPSGIWGDRIGQRATFIRIVLWWSLFTILTGFATGFLSLLAIRFLFGMGESRSFSKQCSCNIKVVSGTRVIERNFNCMVRNVCLCVLVHKQSR